jgi:hypothetical protein
MDFKEACDIILGRSGFEYSLGTSITPGNISSSTYDYGKFYGTGSGALGAGQIYDGIRYPLFSPSECLFDTVEGKGIVLSHECDISQENNRPFNDFALICPVIPLEEFVPKISDVMLGDEGRLTSLFTDLGRDSIYRVMFFPPISGKLPYGGVIYLNQITHAHINLFSLPSVKLITSVSEYGLRLIDYKITNHLLRPKASTL